MKIAPKTYAGVDRAMQKLIVLFPDADNVYPMHWTPEDFTVLRARLGEGVGVNTKAQYVVYVRAMFMWAANVRKMIARLPDWGDQFKHVAKHQKDKARYPYQKEHGERRFELDDARTILIALQRAVHRASDGLAPSFTQSDFIIKRIMGHEIEGSADDYIKLRPDQLRPITDGVRALLLDMSRESGRDASPNRKTPVLRSVGDA